MKLFTFIKINFLSTNVHIFKLLMITKQLLNLLNTSFRKLILIHKELMYLWVCKYNFCIIYKRENIFNITFKLLITFRKI